MNKYLVQYYTDIIQREKFFFINLEFFSIYQIRYYKIKLFTYINSFSFFEHIEHKMNDYTNRTLYIIFTYLFTSLYQN